jgi:hypothetical protein
VTAHQDEVAPRRRRFGRWVGWGALGAIGAYVVYVAVAAVVVSIRSGDETRAGCTAQYAHDGGQAAHVRDALDRTAQSGTGAPLAELTPLPWDMVYVFPASAVVARPGDVASGPADVRAIVGCHAMLPYRPDFPLGSVLFFERGGKVVRALEVGYDLVGAQGPWTWTSAVRVEPGGPEANCAARCLRLVEPR